MASYLGDIEKAKKESALRNESFDEKAYVERILDYAQALVDEYTGTGIPQNDIPRGRPGFEELIRADHIVGKYHNGSDYVETDSFIIHYSKNGCHVVPCRPREGG